MIDLLYMSDRHGGRDQANRERDTERGKEWGGRPAQFINSGELSSCLYCNFKGLLIYILINQTSELSTGFRKQLLLVILMVFVKRQLSPQLISF